VIWHSVGLVEDGSNRGRRVGWWFGSGGRKMRKISPTKVKGERKV